MRSIVESSILNAKNDMEQRMLIESKIKAKTFLNEINSVKKDMKKLEEVIKTSNRDLINESIDILNKSTESFAQLRIEKDFSDVVGKDIEEIS